MLDSSDKKTFNALRELIDSCKGNKPIVFWVGAGASKWAGIPLWREMADSMLINFSKYEDLDTNDVREHLNSGNLTEVFSQLKIVNSGRYHEQIIKLTKGNSNSPVYSRFVRLLKGIQPTTVLTTNIDELLEQSIPGITVLQNSDIERLTNLIQDSNSALCKLHGSVSNINSIIFTTQDYKNLYSNENYLDHLHSILSQNIVIFIGTSLADREVLIAIERSHKSFELLGAGPHFVIAPSQLELPDLKQLRIIQYSPKPSKDHRTSLQVIEEIAIWKKEDTKGYQKLERSDNTGLLSAHLLIDPYPPGTKANSSQTLTLTNDESDVEISAVVGMGFNDNEWPSKRSNILRDLVIGLLCYENLFASFETFTSIFKVLPQNMFNELLKQNILKFIYTSTNVAIIYPQKVPGLGGDLGNFHSKGKGNTEKTPREALERVINVTKGNEEVKNNLIELILNHVEVFDPSEAQAAQITRDILLRPSIRATLGISGGMPIASIPTWNKFAILRLAEVAKTGLTCLNYKIPSVSLPYGLPFIAGPAFSALSSSEWTTGNLASFVITGTFKKEIHFTPQNVALIFGAILNFRDTEIGVSFRKAILEHLVVDQGTDFITEIEGNLSQAISPELLEDAKNQMISLMKCEVGPVKAISQDAGYKETERLWKKRAFNELDGFIKLNNLSLYGQCPCGSGEKLKFCCYEALKR